MKRLIFMLLFVYLAVTSDARIVRHSMGGDIDVDNAPDGAVLRTMGGDIRIERAGESVVAKTMGGNIHVNRLEGSIDAGTMGGNVRVEVVGSGIGRSIELASMGGTIEVTLPKDFAASFDIELEQDDDRPTHKIISDFPLHIRESTRRQWFRERRILTATGTSGSGGNRVRIRTIGADITICSK
jgi:DUF4097 and DUF4098 domain-containing protein YvlB